MTSIVPKGATHINPVLTTGFSTGSITLFVSSTMSSLIADYLLRITGTGRIFFSNTKNTPLIVESKIQSLLIHRTLRLNCLTKYYSELWEECAGEIKKDNFVVPADAKHVKVLLSQKEFELPWKALTGTWEWASPLRTDYARRWALLEIDVLVAMGMGLTLEQLQLIYRIQFGVSQQYERVDQYDAKGRRLPNTARKDPGGKELREALKKITDAGGKVDAPIKIRYPVDGGTREEEKTFYPPFVGVDRNQEYAWIWEGMRGRV
jgi:hypothetical protein